jgi:hypothetical protein
MNTLFLTRGHRPQTPSGGSKGPAADGAGLDGATGSRVHRAKQIEALLRELPDSKRNRNSEQLSADQLAQTYFPKRWSRISPAWSSAVAHWPVVWRRKASADAGRPTAATRRPNPNKLYHYLLEIEAEVLPKSPEGRAARYTLKNWTALTRYYGDGDLDIDNNDTERPSAAAPAQA